MTKTGLFIVALVVAIVIADFYFILGDGAPASISATLIRWSYSYPSIPFLVGFVMGHLFWRMSDKRVYGDKEKK